MAGGFSLSAFAGEIGVSYSTCTLWEVVHPEFSEAIKRGRAKAGLWWEKKLHRVAEQGGGPGTATAVIFGLKNRCADEWRDTAVINHGGSVAFDLTKAVEADELVMNADEPGPQTPVL